VLRSASGIYGEKATRVCVFGDGFVTYATAQQVIRYTSTRNLERVFCSTASYLYDMRFNKELRLGSGFFKISILKRRVFFRRFIPVLRMCID
jgi:hypothetical protein